MNTAGINGLFAVFLLFSLLGLQPMGGWRCPGAVGGREPPEGAALR